METNLERAFQAARDALEWLEKEHERYREATVQSQEQVHDYKFKEEVVGIDEQYKAVLETVSTLQNSWSELHAKRIEQEAVQKGPSVSISPWKLVCPRKTSVKG